jgi:hypothetical protein
VKAVVVSGWDRFTDLGQGSWLLGLGLVVAVGLGVALYVGHGDTGASACRTADPTVRSVLALDGQPSLTSSQTNQLHADSTLLAAAAKDAAGETRTVLEYVAGVAGDAQEARPFDAGFTQGKFDSVCSFSRTGAGGGGNRGSVG